MKVLRAWGRLALVALLPLFVVFANTQIKDLFDRFTSGCVFVVDKEVNKDGTVLVTGHIAGQPPKSLPLVFQGRNMLLNTIVLERPSPGDAIDNLALHPNAGQACPGSLCRDAGPEVDREMMEVVLADMRPEFDYRFRVRVKALPQTKNAEKAKDASEDDLLIYAIFDSGLQGGVCRVQALGWSNFWVWGSPFWKGLAFLIIFVIGTWALTGLGKGGSSSP